MFWPEFCSWDDQVGEWVEEHLDEELTEVEGIVEEVRTLASMWM
jgi:hypothetical protein